MRFKSHRAGQIFGLIQLIFWILLMIWTIIVLPLNLYLRTSNRQIPEWLQKIYSIKFFNWEATSVVILLVITIILGIFLIWVGWYEMHPVKIKGVERTRQMEIDRLRAVKNFSKEKFLINLHKQIYGKNVPIPEHYKKGKLGRI